MLENDDTDISHHLLSRYLKEVVAVQSELSFHGFLLQLYFPEVEVFLLKLLNLLL